MGALDRCLRSTAQHERSVKSAFGQRKKMAITLADVRDTFRETLTRISLTFTTLSPSSKQWYLYHNSFLVSFRFVNQTPQLNLYRQFDPPSHILPLIFSPCLILCSLRLLSLPNILSKSSKAYQECFWTLGDRHYIRISSQSTCI